MHVLEKVKTGEGENTATSPVMPQTAMGGKATPLAFRPVRRKVVHEGASAPGSLVSDLVTVSVTPPVEKFQKMIFLVNSFNCRVFVFNTVRRTVLKED